MSQILFFFLEFFIFLITSISVPIFFNDVMKVIINNINNCFKVFNQKNIKDITFFINEYKYKYLGHFLLYILFNCLIFAFSLTIWFIFSRETIGIYLSISFIIIFLFTCLWLYFLMKKYWKKIKEIGFQSKKTAIKNFEKFWKECKVEKVNLFTLFENNKIALRNFPFQFQQKKYKKKNFRLKQKFINQKINQEKYQIKLLIFFITYLKVYTRFIIWMKDENKKKKKETNITIENQKYNDITLLPGVLISNFFAFVG